MFKKIENLFKNFIIIISTIAILFWGSISIAIALLFLGQLPCFDYNKSILHIMKQLWGIFICIDVRIDILYNTGLKLQFFCVVFISQGMYCTTYIVENTV